MWIKKPLEIAFCKLSIIFTLDVCGVVRELQVAIEGSKQAWKMKLKMDTFIIHDEW